MKFFLAAYAFEINNNSTKILLKSFYWEGLKVEESEGKKNFKAQNNIGKLIQSAKHLLVTGVQQATINSPRMVYKHDNAVGCIEFV